jgi:RNA polymerase sigma factor (sigma-70 family)
LNAVIQYLRRRVAGSGAGDSTDRHLLARFVADRDEAAFEAILRRHGPMVLGVCRRVLGHEADAEDAFQATFLVLARKARSLRKPELLGNWLYGVANRTAAKARAQAAKRQAHERQVAAMPTVNPAHEVVWRELRPLLDAEVARLPEKYRAPFVLCYLEGRTNEAAAALLGCPAGTVFSRLAWARERLRGRLTRRGLTLTGTALLALLAEQATAAVPAPLLNATTRAAAVFAADRGAAGAISPHVASITQGVLRAMSRNRMKTVAVFLLALAAAGAGAGAALQHLRAAKPEETLEEAGNPAGAPLPRGGAAVRWREQGHWKADHAGAIAAVLSPDGKALATGGNDAVVKLWDVATAKAVTTFPAKEGTGRASALAFSPDGRTLAAGSPLAPRTVLWDTAAGTERLTLPAEATALAFSPDGKRLATGHFTAIRLWDVATGKELGALRGHACHVHALAFLPDGQTLVSGAGNDYPVRGRINGEIRLWDLTTRRAQVLLESRDTTGRIHGLAVSRDGRRLASAGWDSASVRLWDLSTGKEVAALRPPPSGYPSSSSVVFSPDGKTLAAPWRPPQNAPAEDAAAGVLLWDLRTSHAPTLLRGRGPGVTSIAFSRDGETLVAAGYVPGPLVGATLTVWRAGGQRGEGK